MWRRIAVGSFYNAHSIWKLSYIFSQPSVRGWRSSSEWSSPVVLVPKKDGTLWFCLDFRKLNSVSKFDPYPMPRVDELVERPGRAKYLSTLDLCKGYWQVQLKPACKEFTAFRTPFGQYQFRVLPFGLHRAPATFQRMMDQQQGIGAVLLQEEQGQLNKNKVNSSQLYTSVGNSCPERSTIPPLKRSALLLSGPWTL